MENGNRKFGGVQMLPAGVRKQQAEQLNGSSSKKVDDVIHLQNGKNKEETPTSKEENGSSTNNDRKDDLRSMYRKFLNSPIGRQVDPKVIMPQLLSAEMVEEDDAKQIEHESTLSQRQYWLFIRLLPTLGPEITERLVDILKLSGHGKAAGVLSGLIEAYHISSSSGSSTRHEHVFRKSSRVQQFSFQKLTRSTSNGSSGFSEDSSLPSPISENGNADIAFPAPVFTRIGGTFRVEQHDESDAASFASAAFENFNARAIRLEFALDTRPTSAGTSSASASAPAAVEAQTHEIRFDELAATGSLIAPEKVKLGDLIGRGSFAVVYSAIFGGKKVAVKQFRDYDDFTLAMFCDEVAIMRELNHPNVVQFVGFTHKPSDRLLWLISEYIPGGSMRRFCIIKNKQKRLTLDEKLVTASKCWNGLAYLHSKTLCHKDISPDNVLVSNDLSQVKVSDFGLAEFKTLMTTTATQVTGTPMYYPPEFASEVGIIRHPSKSDVYSMGASLAELFSEQWFWSMNGKPRAQFQVMFVLSEQRRSVEKGASGRQPDCWPHVPSNVQKVLKDAIEPNYHQRLDAADLFVATQNLIDEIGMTEA